MVDRNFTFEVGPIAGGRTPLRCNLATLIDTRLLVQANSGGGKSWCLRRLLEQTHGQVQHLVLDPDGEFASLRERFDYLLVGRQGADFVADPRTARVLAERLLELNVSAILDIYELKADARIVFVRHFLEALVEARKEHWHPALVVVDEAHLFCPQKGDAESKAAVIDLATRGRKRGFCVVLATQRLSKLHKDAAAEANNKLIGRTALDLDVARAADELGLSGRQEQQRLRELAPGEFFAYGPALTPLIKRIAVGPVSTTHPKAGARLAFTPPPPTDSIRALLPQLADLPVQAPDQEPESLRQRIAELEEALRDNQRAHALASKAPRDELFTMSVGLEMMGRQVAAIAARFDEPTSEGLEVRGTPLLTAHELSFKPGCIAVAPAMAAAEQPPVDPFGKRRRLNRAAEPSRAPRGASPGRRGPEATVAPAGSPATGDTPTRPQQTILNALAWLERLRPSADRTLLALMADASPKSSAFANNLGALRSAGRITYPNTGSVQLTEKGRALARPEGVPETSPALQASIFRKLPAAQVRILVALVGVYPQALEKNVLAEAACASPTSSAFANNLGALRSLGLLRYPSRGQVVAADALFLPKRTRT